MTKYTKTEIDRMIAENVRLSENYTIGELLASQTAQRLGIKNIPTSDQMYCLQELVTHVLQPVRKLWGPTSVSSGLRSDALNRAVKGSKTSQHMKGQAADIRPFSTLNLLIAANRVIKSDIPFDQIILEFHYTGQPHSGWVHISYDPYKTKQRRSIITIDRHGTRLGIDPRRS